MRSIDPEPKFLEEFSRDAQSDAPIVMINLLRYAELASYPNDFDAEPCSGREAYQRYGALVAPLIGKAEARPIWMGTVSEALIAPDGETWDDAILVHYPSRKHFMEMISSDEYQAAKPHRTAALADSRLIESATLMGLGSE